MAAFEYRVTGTWADPAVAKVVRIPEAAGKSASPR
jgi:uncharacterized protein YhdP